MKFAILSNVNLEPLNKFLGDENIRSYFPPYGNILEEFLNKNSKLYKFNSDAIFIYFDINFFLKDANKLSSKLLNREVDNIILAIKNYQKIYNTKIIISSLALNPSNIFNCYSFEDFETYNSILFNLNKKIFKFVNQNANIDLINLQKVIEQNGYKNIFDDKYIYLGKIPFNQNGFKIITKNLIDILKPLNKLQKKVLILDLDNTLWGGIAAEDKQILLGNDGLGLVYSEFQSSLKYLSRNGIILCICSKNNDQDIKDEFKKNKNFKIKFNDFVIKKINWEQKSKNIIEISKELNLGLDSFVFLDDSEFERAEVKKKLKDVTVPELPKNPEDLNNWFLNNVVNKYFYKKKITKEDKNKKKQYKANQKRKLIQKNLTYKDFLKSLKIKVHIEKNKVQLFDRVYQLIQKVNQFNLTSKRYKESHIKEFFKNNKYDIFTLSYSDIFNHEGVTGLAIMKREDIFKVRIDTFLLSCRILGRDVESIFLKKILNQYKKKDEIYGKIIFTKKNLVCRDFFEKLNFKVIKRNKKMATYKKENTYLANK